TPQRSSDLPAKPPSPSTLTPSPTPTNSIRHPFKIIQPRDPDPILTGRTDPPITHIPIPPFTPTPPLSTNNHPQTPSPPFQQARHPFVIPQATPILLLQSLHSPKHTAPQIYPQLLPYPSSPHPHHITPPPPQRQPPSPPIQPPLHHAPIKPQHLQYLNPHPTSTPVPH
ncbi:beta-ketoacyl-[acyl-carrier-protein] synthase family protein, partial [Staphylococcus epidermidis]